MREVAIIILFIGVGFLGYQYINNRDHVTKERFENAHQTLNEKIDSVRHRVDFLAKKQDTILMNQDRIREGQENLRANQDSLKKGQSVIFQEVSKQEDKSLKDLLW